MRYVDSEARAGESKGFLSLLGAEKSFSLFFPNSVDRDGPKVRFLLGKEEGTRKKKPLAVRDFFVPPFLPFGLSKLALFWLSVDFTFFLSQSYFRVLMTCLSVSMLQKVNNEFLALVHLSAIEGPLTNERWPMLAGQTLEKKK